MKNVSKRKKKTKRCEKITEGILFVVFAVLLSLFASKNGKAKGILEKERIVVTAVSVANEEQKKEYDDSRSVELKAEVQWPGGRVPDPAWVRLEVRGYARSANAGIWKVDAEYELTGPGADFYILECRRAALETRVEIVPKVLEVSIGDAKKPYYSEMNVEILDFEEDTAPVKVSGFMKNGEVTEEPPEGFVLPDLAFEKDVLAKDSPMYRDGNVIVYSGALTLSEKSVKNRAGKMANYRYAPEDERYTKKGDIVLTSAEVTEEDFAISVQKGSGIWMAEKEEYWITENTVLELMPTEDSGYNRAIVTEPLMEDGVWRGYMERYGKNGRLLARSEKFSISYRVDKNPPEGTVLLEGKQRERYFTDTSCRCSLREAWDDLEGEVLVSWFISEKKCGAAELEQQEVWEKAETVTILEEGTWYPYARLQDAAGNVTFLYAGKVILDRTAPEISMEGIREGSILNGQFQVQISAQDANIDKSRSRIQIYRKYDEKESDRTGKTAEVWSLTGVEVCFRAEEIESRGIKDGWYLLKVTAYDRVGNCMTEETVFAVNQGGPKIRLSSESEKYLEQIWHQKGKTLTFVVEDVNDLTNSRILRIRDNEFDILQEGSDYQVNRQTTKEGIRRYEYTILQETFQEEGQYGISFLAEDEAGNRAESDEKNQSFILDRTPPVCMVYPIESLDGKIRLEVECEDDHRFEKICVKKNGEQTLLSEKAKIQLELSFTEGENWVIEAWDAAGNVEKTELSREKLEQQLKRKGFLKTENEEIRNEELSKEKVQKENAGEIQEQKNAGVFNGNQAGKGLVLVLLVLTGAAGVAAAYLKYTKKDIQ